MIQQTSLQAYLLLDPETLTEQQRTIYDILLNEGPKSDNDLQRLTSFKINIVTARRNELLKRGWIRCRGQKKDWQTNMMNKVWGV